MDALPDPVAELEADFDVVARNGYRRTVSYAKVEAVTFAAGDTARLCALLAVELDPGIASRKRKAAAGEVALGASPTPSAAAAVGWVRLRRRE